MNITTSTSNICHLGLRFLVVCMAYIEVCSALLAGLRIATMGKTRRMVEPFRLTAAWTSMSRFAHGFAEDIVRGTSLPQRTSCLLQSCPTTLLTFDTSAHPSAPPRLQGNTCILVDPQNPAALGEVARGISTFHQRPWVDLSSLFAQRFVHRGFGEDFWEEGQCVPTVIQASMGEESMEYSEKG